MAVLEPGAVLMGGRFIVESALGQGGFGEVYLARQTSMARPVAIKVLLPEVADDPTLVQRFKAEAEAAGRLTHPHVLPVYDFLLDDDTGLWFLAMQYVPGGRTLQERLGVSHDPAAVADVIAAVAGALDAAHAAGIIHRDVNPANVLMMNGDWPLLADFGIARLESETKTRKTATGTIVGTPAYISPEQAMGQAVTAKSDQYALAVIAYELLAGRRPFVGDAFSLIVQHASHTPPPLTLLNPSVPGSVRAMVMQALSKDPDARFDSCTEFARALGSAANWTPSVDTLPYVQSEVQNVQSDVRSNGQRDPQRELASQASHDQEDTSGGPPPHGDGSAEWQGYWNRRIASLILDDDDDLDGAEAGGLGRRSVASGEPSVSLPSRAGSPEAVPAFDRRTSGRRHPIMLGGALALTACLLVIPANLFGFGWSSPTPDPDRVGILSATATAVPEPTASQLVRVPVDVRSDPVGADILVDGMAFGVTPAVLDMVPGEHEITISRNSYEPWSRSIKVAETERPVIDVHLAEEPLSRVLEIIGASLGGGPFDDGRGMLRLDSPKSSFLLSEEVHAVVYFKSKAAGVRPLHFTVRERWLVAGGGPPIENERPWEVPTDWPDGFMKFCASASRLDMRGSGTPLRLELLVADRLVQSFEFQVAGGAPSPNRCNDPVPKRGPAVPT